MHKNSDFPILLKIRRITHAEIGWESWSNLSTHSYKTILTEAFKVFHGDMFRPRMASGTSNAYSSKPKIDFQSFICFEIHLVHNN